MHARSAVVDVYGDHLREHGWWGPVAGVVALAQACGVQAPATRTAVSRLVREGWLVAESREGTRGYAATSLARERLVSAHARIYAPGPRPWSGTWHLVVVDHGGDRRRRDQVSASLGYLGYGRLGPGAWVSPWPNPELATVMHRADVQWSAVTGPLDGEVPGSSPELAARVWDLHALDTAYRRFLAQLPAPDTLADLVPEEAYPRRARLVHEWRKFLFSDPGLPAQVLPAGWVGLEARTRFLQVASTLRPAADRYVERTLTDSRTAA
ncbi:PaaX family transcriptional regulator [Ornithinimicrobium cerasi]|uniref:Transcriptional regulator, PaaX family n=1 Tax=Ornithinimicrobium cerasi TaxID=2248773 RepID=A0A285VNN9_9MICO|nr:PaaX family transcriptional regulator C-terminal domain-containing protein [Ornithinimicrobium cerasi]SOC55679.1 transcriptional regulator, PaaX family [Ornithinimicrobium cerasi]